jgi:hypothetical protein
MIILNNKNLILFIILISIFCGVVFTNQKYLIKPAIKHNSLNTDYAKVVITWTPPNNAPTFSVDPKENPTSSTSLPTNAGDSVTFQATAIDGDGDNYYLAICKSNGITANNSGPPTCTGGEWCISGSTASASQASCATTTLAAWSESNDWYGFVCDYHGTDSKCSSNSQGSGDSGSPFILNYRPYVMDATAVVRGENNDNINPGDTIYFQADITDPDFLDILTTKVCKTDSLVNGSCAGGEWCHVDGGAGTQVPLCTSTSALPSEGLVYGYFFVIDEHGATSSSGVSDSTTINNVVPTITSIALNGGSDIDLSAGGEGTTGNININATANITDNNGCADVQSVKALKTYPTGVGAGSCLSQDDNNCYYDISCTGGSCTSEITKTYTCTINFKFNADPTDTGTVRADETWKTTITANDEGSTQSAELSTGVELLSYTSLNVDSSINYGQLEIGKMANGDSLSTTTKIYSSGNTGIDVQLSGTNMTGAGTINVGQQKYATSGVAYSSATALTTSATEFEINCKKPTTTSALPFKTVYWGLQVPSGASAGSYSGTNTFNAVKAETGDW